MTSIYTNSPLQIPQTFNLPNSPLNLVSNIKTQDLSLAHIQEVSYWFFNFCEALQNIWWGVAPLSHRLPSLKSENHFIYSKSEGRPQIRNKKTQVQRQKMSSSFTSAIHVLHDHSQIEQEDKCGVCQASLKPALFDEISRPIRGEFTLSQGTQTESLVQTSCGHSFHDVCLAPWLNRHLTCPLDRNEFLTDEKRGEKILDALESNDIERAQSLFNQGQILSVHRDMAINQAAEKRAWAFVFNMMRDYQCSIDLKSNVAKAFLTGRLGQIRADLSFFQQFMSFCQPSLEDQGRLARIVLDLHEVEKVLELFNNHSILKFLEDWEKDQLLQEFAKLGQVELLMEYLDVHFPDENGYLLLLSAVARDDNNLPLIVRLLKRGSCYHELPNKVCTSSAESGALAILKYILDHYEVSTEARGQALMFGMAKQANLDLLHLLLENKPTTCISNLYRGYAIVNALFHQSMECLLYLLKGVDLTSIPDEQLEEVFKTAIELEDSQFFEFLLENIKDQPDKIPKKVFKLLAYHERFECIQTLLESIKISQMDLGKLLWALSDRCEEEIPIELLKLLFEKALELKLTVALSSLLQSQVELEAIDQEILYSFFLKVYESKVTEHNLLSFFSNEAHLLEFLISKGKTQEIEWLSKESSMNCQTMDSALLVAASMGQFDIIKLLLENANIKSPTALEKVIIEIGKKGNFEVLEWLLAFLFERNMLFEDFLRVLPAKIVEYNQTLLNIILDFEKKLNSREKGE